MLALANVPLSLATPEALLWAEARHGLTETVYSPLWRARSRSPKIGSLIWPTGADRWAEGWFLCDETQLALIWHAATAGGNYQPLTLNMGLPGLLTGFQVSMWLLPPKPLTSIQGAGRLWLLPLVDDRFWWNLISTTQTVAANTTWASLVSTIAGLIPATVTASTVPSAYGYAPPSLGLTEFPVPDLLARVAAGIGSRVRADLAGTYRLVRPEEASAAFETSYLTPRPIVAGGKAILGTGTLPNVGVLPASVTVLFNQIADGLPTRVQTGISVKITDLPELAPVAAVAGKTAYIPTTAVALLTSGALTNQAELKTLSRQVALDYYRWRKYDGLDVKLDGIQPWVPDGLVDIEWHVSDYDCYTRLTTPAATGSCLCACPCDLTAPVPQLATSNFPPIPLDLQTPTGGTLGRLTSSTYNSVYTTNLTTYAKAPTYYLDGPTINVVNNPATVNLKQSLTTNVSTGKQFSIAGPGSVVISAPTSFTGTVDLTAATVSLPALTSITLAQTGLHIQSGTPANVLTIKPNESLTANRTLNIITNDADRTINLANNFITVGNFGLTLTQTGTTSVTLPTSGTLIGTNDTGTVATAMIAAAAVTLAKIANASSNSVLVGAGSSGSGSSYSQIGLGGGLSMSGTTLSLSGAVVRVLDVETSSTTVANTAAETTLLSGAHTFTSANLASGSVVRLTVGGTISTSGPGVTAIINLKMGGTVIGTVTLNPGAVVTVPWQVTITAIIRTTGVGGTGSYVSFGFVNVNNGAVEANGTTAPNTTSNPALDVTATWSAPSPSNSITQNTCLVEQIG